MAATTGIFKTISYVLPATSFTTKQCEQLDSRAFMTVLPRLHINRHLPKVYRYASKQFYGLGLQHTQTVQATEKIKLLLFHANQPTQFSDALLSLLETRSLDMGVATSIFALPYERYSFLMETSWLKDIWKFISKHNITLVAKYNLPRPQRDKDFSLMGYLNRH